MLQYIVNTAAIWLISLALFDLFLRRESYHNYNRFFLLFTFLLGALLPLIHWQDNTKHYSGTFQKPIEQVITAKQTIVSVGTTPSASVNWQLWITLIYMAGAFVALAILMADVFKMIRFYNKGIKTSEQSWTIISTNKSHAPFSFINTLFISDRNLYSDDEWNMILIHERRHTSLLHLLDLILMQISRILFWFNPLVYIYNQRLLMVHEFQADNAAAQKPKAYGSFLIEQAMLHQAPAFSHSFNRSPIKNRIVMLTRKSSSVAKTKVLVFVPLTIVCLFCFSQNTFSHRPEKVGNFAKYRGNTIEFKAPKKPDSYMKRDANGQLHREPIQWPADPIKLNGEKIYYGDDDKNISKPYTLKGHKNLLDCLLQNIAHDCERLDDGEYFLLVTDVVVSTKGEIVYFNNQGIFKDMGDISKQSELKNKIDTKIETLMENAPTLEPALLNNQAVPIYMGSISPFYYGYKSHPDLIIKDHKIMWRITDSH